MLICGQNFGGTKVAKNGGNDWQKKMECHYQNGIGFEIWQALLRVLQKILEINIIISDPQLQKTFKKTFLQFQEITYCKSNCIIGQ